MEIIVRNSDGKVMCYGDDLSKMLVPDDSTLYEYDCTAEEFQESLEADGEIFLQEGAASDKGMPHTIAHEAVAKNPAAEMMQRNGKTNGSPVTYDDLIELVRKLGMEV